MVSLIPFMTEIMPAARATLMATNLAGLSLGRALGALLAPALYARGIGACAFAAALFNLAALAVLHRVRAASEV